MEILGSDLMEQSTLLASQISKVFAEEYVNKIDRLAEEWESKSQFWDHGKTALILCKTKTWRAESYPALNLAGTGDRCFRASHYHDRGSG